MEIPLTTSTKQTVQVYFHSIECEARPLEVCVEILLTTSTKQTVQVYFHSIENKLKKVFKKSPCFT